MTKATKTTHRQNSRLIRQTKVIVRLRRDCEESMVGASQAERRYLKRAIAMLDRIVSLVIEVDNAAESLRKLAEWKPRNPARRSARVSR
jgi:hypothetical protein